MKKTISDLGLNQALALREIAINRHTLIDYYSNDDGTYTVVVIEKDPEPEPVLNYEI